jgi:hypothetical protein
MNNQSKLTLVGLIVVVCVVAFCLLIIIPGLRYLKSMSSKVVCATHLKGLGTAMVVYSNDYDDNYPQLPGSGPWAQDLGFPYYLQKPDFQREQANTLRTISASLYLLVRESDVSPKSFVCPTHEQYPESIKPKNYSEFQGDNPKNLDIIELWDFGHDPHKHVSYAYHNPYGRYAPDGNAGAAFAIAADMSPWFSYGSIQPPQSKERAPQIIQLTEPSTWKFGNSLNHELKKKPYSEGQNVLFGDGHTSYEKQPNVGVKNDNIYTFWSTRKNPTEQDIQGGTAPTSRGPENNAKSTQDSFLAI